MAQPHNYTQSAQQNWQSADAAKTASQSASMGSPFQPRHQSQGLNNPRQSSALPIESPLGGPQVMTLRDAATATGALNNQQGGGLPHQPGNWLTQKFQQAKQYLGGGAAAPQLQPQGPLVGIIDTGFALGEHGHQMLKTIQQGNPDATVLLADSVGKGSWANDLTQFVDVAKASGQSQAVVNLSFDLTQKNPDGTTTTRNELTATERDALLYAQQNGVLVVTSAGNNGGAMSALEQASGRSDNLIVVGAAEGGQRADYSSFGSGLDFLVSLDKNAAAGTSQAAAKTTQTISKIWAANPNLTSRQVVQVLEASTQGIDPSRWTPTKGLGIVNKQTALQLGKETVTDSPRVAEVNALQPAASLGMSPALAEGRVWQGGEGAIATESPNFIGRLASQANRQINQAIRRPKGSNTSRKKLSIPRISLPKPSTPKLSLPKPSLPKPSLPKPSLPKLSLPKPSLPKPSLPMPSLPKPSLPKPSLPKPSLPKPSFPKPSLPKPSLPKPSLPIPLLPKPSSFKPSLPKPSIPRPLIPRPSIPTPLQPNHSVPKPSFPGPFLPRPTFPGQLKPRPFAPELPQLIPGGFPFPKPSLPRNINPIAAIADSIQSQVPGQIFDASKSAIQNLLQNGVNHPLGSSANLANSQQLSTSASGASSGHPDPAEVWMYGPGGAAGYEESQRAEQRSRDPESRADAFVTTLDGMSEEEKNQAIVDEIAEARFTSGNNNSNYAYAKELEGHLPRHLRPNEPASRSRWAGFSPVVHGILQAFGLAPGVGIVPDIIDAAVYAAEGKPDEAAFSIAAAVPGMGDAARVGEWLKKMRGGTPSPSPKPPSSPTKPDAPPAPQGTTNGGGRGSEPSTSPGGSRSSTPEGSPVSPQHPRPGSPEQRPVSASGQTSRQSPGEVIRGNQNHGGIQGRHLWRLNDAGEWGERLDQRTYRAIVDLSSRKPHAIELAAGLLRHGKTGEDIVALLKQTQEEGKGKGFLDVLSQRFNEFSGKGKPFEIGGDLPLDSAHQVLLEGIKPDRFPSPDDLHEAVQAIDFGRRRGGHFWYAKDGKQGIDGYFRSLYTGEESFVSFKNLPTPDIRNVHKELIKNTAKVRGLSLGEAKAEFFAYTRFSKEQMENHLYNVVTTVSQREYAEVFDRVTFICKGGEELTLNRDALATLRRTAIP